MTTASNPTPLDIRKLKVSTINELLTPLYPNTVITSFHIDKKAACGDGIASTADRIHLTLSYQSNPHTLPEQVVLKTLLLNPWLRFGLPAILSLSTSVRALEKLPLIGGIASRFLFIIIGIFQKFFPQAPDAMYDVESSFYHQIRPSTELEAPQVYGARYDANTRQFAVIMEDLNLRQVHFPNATESQTSETVKSTLKQMAQLHAQFWQSERFNSDLNWVPDRLSEGMFPVFDGIGFDLIRYQVEQNHFKSELIAPLGKTVEELCQANWKSQRLLTEGKQTLLHGDTHVGNSYVLPDGQGGLIDFQLLVKGNPIIDVCYFIITAIDSSTRKQEEQNLLHFYLQTLVELGITNAPSFEEAWHDYRVGSLWGLVIGWLITPPVNYGEAITSANIQRTTQAILDVDAFTALEATASRNTVYEAPSHA